jgi:hypothetical protein
MPRADLEAATGLGTKALNNRISKLRQARFVHSGKRGYRETPRFFVGLALLAALGMVAVDARGRPVLASVAYSLTVFVTVSATLARMPAFAQSLPSVPETALAAVVIVAGWRSRGRTRPAGGMAGAARWRGRPRRSHTSVTGVRRAAGALGGAVSYHRGDARRYPPRPP